MTVESAPVLVIGGTGMLAAAVRNLAGRGLPVFVVARHPWQPAGGAPVVFVRGDWARPDDLAADLERARVQAGHGPFGSAIQWIHSPYRERVQRAVADQLAPDATVVVLHGSAAADPHTTHPLGAPNWHAPPRRHRDLVLGFADTPDGRTRWLSDAEIAGAALRALDDPAPKQVAGRVEPWGDRP